MLKAYTKYFNTFAGNKRRMLHIFAGNITFRVSSTGRELAIPKWTARLFHGVPGDVDAVSYYQKTQTQYFFKGVTPFIANNILPITFYKQRNTFILFQANADLMGPKIICHCIN